eukprot:c15614_g1_i2.p1 GENE.c15614_g1_i2~~c15614_g1_i2.p1  ORF type:complete len:129 (-),score=60.67 c15614_g1_i2:14-400(-)
MGKDVEDSDDNMSEQDQQGEVVPVKNPNYHKIRGSGRGRQWKTVKNMIGLQKFELLHPSEPTYANIGAPPSTKPSKKLSDISGDVAQYTDPRTGLFFSNVEEFQIIRYLTPDVIEQYKKLRGQQSIIS